jgi:hypothetical protein
MVARSVRQDNFRDAYPIQTLIFRKLDKPKILRMTERLVPPSLPGSDPAEPRPPKLLERMRIHLRTRH